MKLLFLRATKLADMSASRMQDVAAGKEDMSISFQKEDVKAVKVIGLKSSECREFGKKGKAVSKSSTAMLCQ
ncbi:hypothetical protein Dimus_033717 [Dionaea muscipula]